MMTTQLYILQRVSALMLVPLVFTHLALMIYAVQGGLSAEEILSRTRGNDFWMLFYTVFVVVVAVHAAIGVRVIAHEMLKLSGSMLLLLSWLLFFLLLAAGLFAVYAVTLG